MKKKHGWISKHHLRGGNRPSCLKKTETRLKSEYNKEFKERDKTKPQSQGRGLVFTAQAPKVHKTERQLVASIEKDYFAAGCTEKEKKVERENLGGKGPRGKRGRREAGSGGTRRVGR